MLLEQPVANAATTMSPLRFKTNPLSPCLDLPRAFGWTGCTKSHHPNEQNALPLALGLTHSPNRNRLPSAASEHVQLHLRCDQNLSEDP